MGCLVDLEQLRISLLEGSNRIQVTDFDGKLKGIRFQHMLTGSQGPCLQAACRQ